MTDPIFKRTAAELVETFQADAVLIVSWNRWGQPTVVSAIKPDISGNDEWAVGNFQSGIQALVPTLQGDT